MKQVSYLVALDGITLSEENNKNVSWVHALPFGAYKHQIYGTIDVTADRVQRFTDSVKKKVRGIDPSVNYSHDGDGEAAGWIKDAESRSDGLWVLVEWTVTAAQKIKEKAFKYFSSEFYDEWEDPKGNKFQDVIFGGALTNRPFMKNMVPVNLSEGVVENAFDLVSAITGKNVNSLKGGAMDEKDLEKIVEGVVAKLAEAKAPKPETSLGLADIEDLKKLAEDNPLVAGLMRHVETQGLSLAETAKKLRETEVTSKFQEFEKGSKLVFSPVARKLLQEILLEMPAALSEKFWQLMKHVRTNQAFMVELGERAGARISYGEGKTAATRFSEMTAAKVAEGMSYPDAVSAVASANNELYQEYRDEMLLSG